MDRLLKHFFLIILVFFINSGLAADDETCMMCHSDEGLTGERNGQEISMYVNMESLKLSPHAQMDCISCHPDADVEELPHSEELDKVKCNFCHDQVQEKFETGIHGMALADHQPYAPTCVECHGQHDILRSSNPEAETYRMNIPFLCGKCHREGAPVARVYNITEHNILDNYSQSIHGEALFKKGLTVSATCVDCHKSHEILPHTDSGASTHKANIAETCMQCHSRIEDVHVQIIEGEKWQESPQAIPACNDCHLPHKARKPSNLQSLSDRSCLKCHDDKTLHMQKDGQTISLYVDEDHIEESVHQDVTCVKCHADVDSRRHRPCETAQKVNCSACHTNVSKEYSMGGHSKAVQQDIEGAPQCKTCHGTHHILSHENEQAPIYRANIPQLCGECHSDDKEIKAVQDLSEVDALFDYSKSVHGKQLMEQGLLPSAVCSDCHNAHQVLNHKDPLSSVNQKNIPATCSECHKGIYKEFTNSVHFAANSEVNKDLPTCTHCHSAHRIQNVGQDQFVVEVTQQCGSCHEDLSESYTQTMHGKAYQLGYLKSAKCSDCHNAHLILPSSHPNSSIHFTNIVSTCQNCHEDANVRFTGYLTHATHHDKDKYPILFYVYWFMTILLVSVFVFFGIHTLLWLPKSIRELRKRKAEKATQTQNYYVRRFELSQRITHLFVIISFLALAFTGMMLKFSSMAWAGFFSDLIGGVRVAGVIHRLAALITFGYFIGHLILLIRKKRDEKTGFKDFFFGPNSMMFNLKDIKDFGATIKWFLGFGERPDYGRWTYWEKFDYFAVFWGVAIIGISGLMLWFPEFFTLFLPGWLINVATIIHSDEALLAVGFIFTIHFFNTHLRPEVFPMDKVIFTGLVPLEEYKKDRPHEYRRLMESREIRKKLVKEGENQTWDRIVGMAGFIFLSLGLLLIVLIIYSELFGYK
ncbi:MAG: hypothetical protein GF313_08360 [Caldithrix sp.]|nr:hypothetical protein [Caldithrix sp.]